VSWPVAGEPSLRLRELAVASVAVAALRVQPRDRDVDEPLQEVALGIRRDAPLVLELLVRIEVGAVANELQSALVERAAEVVAELTDSDPNDTA